MFDEEINSPLIKIHDKVTEDHGVELYMKREDLIDEFISGNKYRKLKYNLLYAREKGHDTLLTFGGAYSNHIHASAYAGYSFGFKTIGIIRGEEHVPLNPTLSDAEVFGMKLYYVERKQYRHRNTPEFRDQILKRFGNVYLVPEGGSNALAVKGCTEIAREIPDYFNHICIANGTGGTIAGLIAGMEGKKQIWGFPILKGGEFLKPDIKRLINEYNGKKYSNWDLICDYHFGGYAKYNIELVYFVNSFFLKHKIPLDPIYTGKLMYGIFDKIKTGFFKRGDRILAIHTGGIQGVRGFNERFGELIYCV